MNYMDIKRLDIANGPGCRISIFVSGCTHQCKDCFNPEAWPFDAGQPYTEETEAEILKLLEPDYITGLSILGGEPFEWANEYEVLDLIQAVRKKFGKSKTIWIYTGAEFQGLYYGDPTAREIFELVDIVVDGSFETELKDITLQYCGSSNQRIIDARLTMATRQIVECDKYDVSNPIRRTGRLLAPIDD